MSTGAQINKVSKQVQALKAKLSNLDQKLDALLDRVGEEEKGGGCCSCRCLVFLTLALAAVAAMACCPCCRSTVSKTMEALPDSLRDLPEYLQTLSVSSLPEPLKSLLPCEWTGTCPNLPTEAGVSPFELEIIQKQAETKLRVANQRIAALERTVSDLRAGKQHPAVDVMEMCNKGVEQIYAIDDPNTATVRAIECLDGVAALAYYSGNNELMHDLNSWTSELQAMNYTEQPHAAAGGCCGGGSCSDKPCDGGQDRSFPSHGAMHEGL